MRGRNHVVARQHHVERVTISTTDRRTAFELIVLAVRATLRMASADSKGTFAPQRKTFGSEQVGLKPTGGCRNEPPAA
jgi:hypothetical protein